MAQPIDAQRDRPMGRPAKIAIIVAIFVGLALVQWLVKTGRLQTSATWAQCPRVELAGGSESPPRYAAQLQLPLGAPPSALLGEQEQLLRAGNSGYSQGSASSGGHSGPGPCRGPGSGHSVLPSASLETQTHLASVHPQRIGVAVSLIPDSMPA